MFKQYPEVWSCIIVFTQIATSVSKYLPYTARVKGASASAHEYRQHQIWAEGIWCQIESGELTVSQINKARLDLKAKTSKTLKAHFPHGDLPEAPALMDKALTQSYQYLQSHFGEEDHEE
ncbi:hypothetical protein [Chromobacterium haemolyticum]|uniref:hypothetical protein n=1 Tax=Chromobacterium haemolyticum TaxID=394935 RepID=UPI00244C43CB|nr:hypothetical protein [Chromobacterium haemolyticum]MDH0342045.1 hypothetical protein [Chromobacterium haemolyticum]